MTNPMPNVVPTVLMPMEEVQVHSSTLMPTLLIVPKTMSSHVKSLRPVSKMMKRPEDHQATEYVYIIVI